MMDWFRSWHGAPMDAKFMVVARRANVAPGMVSAVYWSLLDYASQNDPRGSVDGFDTETYAEWSGWSETDVVSIIEALTSKKLITSGRLTSWDKRQPKREDDSAERVRRHREKVRYDSVTEENVTQCNAVKHTVTKSNHRLDSDQIRSDPDQRIDDGGLGAARSSLQVLGLWTKDLNDRFADLWPELHGRQDWIGQAITITRDAKPRAPLPYAIKVLANAVHLGQAPGYEPPAKTNGRSYGPQDRDLDAILGITEVPPRGRQTNDPEIIEASFSFVSEGSKPVYSPADVRHG